MLELAMSPAPDQKQHSIILYRESRTRITVAVNTLVEQENGTKEEVNIRTINTQDDVFIPYYAFQQLDAQVNGSPAISLGYEGGASLVAHNLMCEEDVCRFQHALTEYEPVANISKVKFKIALSELFSLRPRSIQGEGRAQIWRWEKMSAESSTTGHPLTSPASSNTSPGYSAYSNITDDTMQKMQQVINSDGGETVSMMQDNSDVIVWSKRIHPPVLVIFTTLEKKLTILHCQCKHHVLVFG